MLIEIGIRRFFESLTTNSSLDLRTFKRNDDNIFIQRLEHGLELICSSLFQALTSTIQ